MKTILLIGVMILMGSCSNKLEYYKDTKPVADIQHFFNGKLKAWGLIQDFRGKVTLRFEVDMIGTWDGNKGKLEEVFYYDNGKTQERVWLITKNDDGSYSGTANDILGVAKGMGQGSAVNWIYSMDVPVGDTTYRLKFDDWLWSVDNNVWINRSYLKKFGITVAELTLFIQKQ